MSEPDCAVRLADVAHRYGRRTALAGVSLEIPAGALAGLIGPDGIGKSTLLGLIAGARRIQRGRVDVLGQDMRSARVRRALQPRIAYMPQGLGRHLYPALSVADNVDFFARVFGLSAAERARRIAALLASTGLAPFRDRLAGRLSGGMKQKLGLCCALVHDPDLLILDEPTTGIDPRSRRQFWELIARVRGLRPETSVLVATAYMPEAEAFDWLAVMDAGRVLATGTPAALEARTGTRDLDAAFVALLPAGERGSAPLATPPLAPADGGPAIEAIELTRRFGDFVAVDRISFRIERGEIFGFIGSNGCGKTTTMKMVTGLLPVTSGEARLFGQRVDARDAGARQRVGYMSQGFSLYGELTVRENVALHARLFRIPAARAAARIAALLDRFDLREHADVLAEALPLGIRQRLSLAVAVVHEPQVLILDEPTSGVDPVARDRFWALLVELSRRDRVTIFVSTHFMNEGERCDRVSLMHAGRVLATGPPAALARARNAATLEEAFVAHIAEATGEAGAGGPAALSDGGAPRIEPRPPARFSAARLAACARREALDLGRDPIRLVFALLGSAILMVVLGYGMGLDVEDLAFAALDRDDSPESRAYVDHLAGSRYFIARPPAATPAELDRRMQAGELALAIELPPGYGRDLRRGRAPEVGVWVDGAMPFRGETIRGYVEGAHQGYLEWLAARAPDPAPRAAGVEIEMRYRYNQAFRSLDAMVPAVIPLLLLMVPSILTAIAVVREKELGSITNFYATPVSRLEFLVGKQLPYVAVAMASFAVLVALAVAVFRVPLAGSGLALSAGAFLYVLASTGTGLLMSAFTKSQIAALFGTAIATLTPATQFAGLTDPVSSLEGPGRIVGELLPVSHFLTISRGTFNKALGFADLGGELLAVAAAVPVVLGASLLLLRKQAR